MIHRARAAFGRWRDDLVGAAVAVVLTSVVTVVHYQLWWTRPGIPFQYRGDGLLYGMYEQSVLDGGWYYHVPRLGFPFGLDQIDRPLSDQLPLAMTKVLGWIVGGDGGRMANLLLLLSFPLVALAAYVAMRWVRASRSTSVVVAVLYAFAPYHLERGTGHLYYSFYWFLPFAVVVLVRQLRGEPAGLRSWAAWLTAAAIPLTGNYYAIFFAALAVVLAAFQLVVGGRRGWRTALSTALLGVVALVVMVVAMSPALLAGSDARSGYDRNYSESEIFGLRIDKMLLPGTHHVLAAVRGPAERIEAGTFSGVDNTPYLGIVAAIGFVAALGFALRRTRDADEPWLSTAYAFGLVVAASVVIAVPAGLGSVLSSFGFTQIRAWNRMSIIIAFAGLAVLALAADRLLRGRSRLVRWALLGLVVAVGLVDQLPPIDSAKRHEEIAEYGRDAAFFDVLESSLPPAAAVFELPAVPYPEHPQVYDLEDYELMRGYFHTDQLRFSYGALKTRVPPWDRELQCRSLSELLAGAVVAGFDALYVDTLGWPETMRGAVEPTVNEVLGGPIVRTDDGRMVAWDLGDLRERLADDPPADLDGLRDAVLAGVDTTRTDLTGVARALGLPARTAPLVACPAP